MPAKLLYIDFCHVLTLLEGFNATLEISNGRKNCIFATAFKGKKVKGSKSKKVKGKKSKRIEKIRKEDN